MQQGARSKEQGAKSAIADHKSEIPNPKSQRSPLPAPRSPLPAPPRRPLDPRRRLPLDRSCLGSWATACKTGQSLHLAAGVAEITFDVGANVILQAPAAFEVESATSARLEMGKATAEITTAAARGFKIRTPQATFVDQGTEFGVEVSPGGGSRVHVFKGCVDVAIDGEGGKAQPASQRLMENAGARLEGDSPSMTLVEDTGESFIRSMDQSGRDRHVVAYWRFEDRPLGMLLPHTHETHPRHAGHDRFLLQRQRPVHLLPSTQPHFSGDVPAGVVPQTAAANRGCLDTSAPPGGAAHAGDLYTLSAFSHASPLDIQKITPAEWTIEASVKPARLHCGCQTFVVRDGTLMRRPMLEQDRAGTAAIGLPDHGGGPFCHPLSRRGRPRATRPWPPSWLRGRTIGTTRPPPATAGPCGCTSMRSTAGAIGSAPPPPCRGPAPRPWARSADELPVGHRPRHDGLKLRRMVSRPDRRSPRERRGVGPGGISLRPESGGGQKG